MLAKIFYPMKQFFTEPKKHYIIFLIPMLWTLMIFVFLFSHNPIVVKLSIVPAMIALGSWGSQFLNYLASEFVVTNKRVFLREGFFVRHVNETRMATIANITVNQGLIAQWLDYGNVFINTFGGEDDPFSEIASPNKFKNQVQMQLDKLGK